ncbi:MAG: hypothetical protein GY754_02035 [bacterium]|nr:hypothetical protein [bacterium]
MLKTTRNVSDEKKWTGWEKLLNSVYGAPKEVELWPDFVRYLFEEQPKREDGQDLINRRLLDHPVGGRTLEDGSYLQNIERIYVYDFRSYTRVVQNYKIQSRGVGWAIADRMVQIIGILSDVATIASLGSGLILKKGLVYIAQKALEGVASTGFVAGMDKVVDYGWTTKSKGKFVVEYTAEHIRETVINQKGGLITDKREVPQKRTKRYRKGETTQGDRFVEPPKPRSKYFK